MPLSIRPILYKNGLRSLSCEKIIVLDSYFIHRYIIITNRSGPILDKIHQLFRELWPFFTLMFAGKNGFRSLALENISVLDSYFIHRYIIIKYRSFRFGVKSTNCIGSYGPFQLNFYLKNGFHSSSFENVTVLESYIIHRRIIIKYRSSSIFG